MKLVIDGDKDCCNCLSEKGYIPVEQVKKIDKTQFLHCCKYFIV